MEMNTVAGHVGFEAKTAEIMNSNALWDLTLCTNAQIN
jgi:hypothetical protein